MEERVWTKHYFSVHFTTFIGDVKLSTNVVYGRNGLWNPSFTNGFTKLCRYWYFCFEILFYFVSIYFTIFFKSLKSKSTKRKLGSFVQRYSFKVRALHSWLKLLKPQNHDGKPYEPKALFKNIYFFINHVK